MHHHCSTLNCSFKILSFPPSPPHLHTCTHITTHHSHRQMNMPGPHKLTARRWDLTGVWVRPLTLSAPFLQGEAHGSLRVGRRRRGWLIGPCLRQAGPPQLVGRPEIRVVVEVGRGDASERRAVRATQMVLNRPGPYEFPKIIRKFRELFIFVFYFILNFLCHASNFQRVENWC